MRKIIAFIQYLLRSLIYAHKKTLVSDLISVIATLTLTLTAYMVSFFIHNYKQTLMVALRGIHVLVYLQDKPSESAIERIRGFPWVSDVRRYSGESLLMEELGKKGTQAFKKAGISFPWVLEIAMKNDNVPADEVKKSIEEVLSPVYVDTGEVLSRSLRIFVTLVGLLTIAVGVLFLLGISVVVAGGVRNNILMEKESIEVLNLVGATRGYIFFPYMLKQAYMTCFSLLTSLVVFKLILRASLTNWRDFELVFQVKDLPLEFYTITIITGTLIAVISSYFSLRRLV